MGRNQILAMVFGGALVAMIVNGASAQTDQERIADSISSCIEIGIKYNFTSETPEQLQRYCVFSAYKEVFIDHCMALDTSWLKLGRHGYCVDLATKQFGD